MHGATVAILWVVPVLCWVLLQIHVATAIAVLQTFPFYCRVVYAVLPWCGRQGCLSDAMATCHPIMAVMLTCCGGRRCVRGCDSSTSCCMYLCGWLLSHAVSCTHAVSNCLRVHASPCYVHTICVVFAGSWRGAAVIIVSFNRNDTLSCALWNVLICRLTDVRIVIAYPVLLYTSRCEESGCTTTVPARCILKKSCWFSCL